MPSDTNPANSSPSNDKDIDPDALEASLSQVDPSDAPEIAEEIADVLGRTLDASGTETPTERRS